MPHPNREFSPPDPPGALAALPHLRPALQSLGLDPPPAVRSHLPGFYRSLGDGSTEWLGLRTGFPKFDTLNAGLQGLIILAGQPGTGKTSLALQMAFESALQFGTPVLFYSLEMGRNEVLARIVSRTARASRMDVLLHGRTVLDPACPAPNTRFASTQPFDEARRQLAAVQDHFFLLDRTDGQPNFDRLAEDIQTVRALTGRPEVFVLIDYLQIFPLEDPAQSLKEKIDRLLDGFVHLQRHTGATLLLISQKNRSGYTSSGLDTLMGSAGIEYAADLVLLLNHEREDAPAHEGFAARANVDLVVAKNRHGARGVIPFVFEGMFSEFRER